MVQCLTRNRSLCPLSFRSSVDWNTFAWKIELLKPPQSCFPTRMSPEETKPAGSPAEDSQKSAADDAKEHTNNHVAVTFTILAVLMVITKVTDDNVCQAIDNVKANEVNTWSYYQSKSFKQNLAELGRTEFEALALTAPPEARAKIDA